MAFLTAEQKQALGPVLGLVYIIAAALGAIAIYHVFGGEPIPFLSQFTAVVLGVVSFFVLLKQLKS